MDSLPQALGKRYGIPLSPSADRGGPRNAASVHETSVVDPALPAAGDAVPGLQFETAVRRRRRRPSTERASWRAGLALPLKIYLASRLLYLVIVVIDSLWHGWSLTTEVTNWDGVWYDALAHYGYPHFALSSPTNLYDQTTLGFLPLFSMLMLGLSHISPLSNADSGLLISTIGGFIATVLVGRLAELWWDRAASRRVMIFFCFFPGSIVFSMVYSEGILIPLVAGCFLALEHRRWFLAGVLAAAATAVAPVAVAIIPACGAAALRALWLSGHLGFDRPRAVVMPILRGLRDRDARRSLWAPLLAPIGLAAFAFYLWRWTGTPLASYRAQRYGWDERSSLLALWNQGKHAITELVALHHINLNYDSGLIGGIFLIVALVMLLRSGNRHRVSLAAIIWTLWCALETLTSWNTPPNPRMLICAFPALMVVAARVRGVGFRWLIGVSTVLLVVMSFLTYYGTTLRP
jgi:hypothetical protein